MLLKLEAIFMLTVRCRLSKLFWSVDELSYKKSLRAWLGAGFIWVTLIESHNHKVVQCWNSYLRNQFTCSLAPLYSYFISRRTCRLSDVNQKHNTIWYTVELRYLILGMVEMIWISIQTKLFCGFKTYKGSVLSWLNMNFEN